MPRRIFNILAAISLLFWLLIVAADHEVFDNLEIRNGYFLIRMEPDFVAWTDPPPTATEKLAEILGISVSRTTSNPIVHEGKHKRRLPGIVIKDQIVRITFVPYLLPATLVLILWLNRFVIGRSSSAGIQRSHALCPICKYDLRATPHRCPECGHVVDGSLARNFPPLSV